MLCLDVTGHIRKCPMTCALGQNDDGVEAVFISSRVSSFGSPSTPVLVDSGLPAPVSHHPRFVALTAAGYASLRLRPDLVV